MKKEGGENYLKKHPARKYSGLLAGFLLGALLLVGCGKTQQPENNTPITPQLPPVEQPKEPEVPAVAPARVTLVAAGDNLLHNTISFNAKQADGSYDFRPVYAPVADLVAGADIAFINQEVPLSGTIGKYPMLDAPQSAADALVDTGFNLINQASNHALDKGVDGLMTTLAGWQQRGITYIGAFSSPEDAATPRLMEVDGLTLGFLGYTYGTNGIPIPQGREYIISLIEKERMAAEIAALRPQCDYLVVSLHWGTEYSLSPSQSQRELAQLVADSGADLIIGHHPHVIQPAEWIVRADGGKTFCAYSLGNFVSSQDKKETMLGGLLGLTVVRHEDGTIETQGPGVLPVMTHFEDRSKNYRVYPLEEYPQELIAKHSLRKKAGALTLKYYNDLARQVLGEFMQTKETFACQP